jgi:LL-diaminopimelate aminotransferase
MYLNYPNNPTSACATPAFFERAVTFAREHDVLIAQDAAYCDLYFDESVKPASILQVDGAKDVAIELHSLSKTFNMTGWRVAFAVGNREALASLGKVKNNADSGIFGATQEAAIEALSNLDHAEVRAQMESYRRRRDILIGSLKEAGWEVTAPLATFYVWAKCPGGADSMTVAKRVLDEADVVVIPGAGFGPCGEGYVRFALTVDEGRTKEAGERIGKLAW